MLPLIVLAVAIAATGGLQWLFANTALGRSFRAVSDDREIAELMGLNAKKVYALATAIAFVLIAIAGALQGMRTTVSPSDGPLLLLFAFEAVIIGGMGSFWGTLAGAMILGITQQIGFRLDPGWGIWVGHLVFLGVLVLRPQGLFPKTVRLNGHDRKFLLSRRRARNVLFIMCDQLRADYLSCYGHLAPAHAEHRRARGARVRFDRAYVQGSVCGASRMSTYTGRYVSTHGAMWNFVPLSVGQKTLGEHLRPHGVRCALVGKTHVEADLEGAKRLGIDVAQGEGRLAMEGGFEPYARDDGIWPPGFKVRGNAYRDWLREQRLSPTTRGMTSRTRGRGPNGEILSGWRDALADKPAGDPGAAQRDALHDRPRDRLHEGGRRYAGGAAIVVTHRRTGSSAVVPAPYHEMFGPTTAARRAQRSRSGRTRIRSLEGARRDTASESFSRDEVRRTVIPTYMGPGTGRRPAGPPVRLHARSAWTARRWSSSPATTATTSATTASARRELFHEPIVRVPLIVADPRAEANATRGTAGDALVEASTSCRRCSKRWASSGPRSGSKANRCCRWCMRMTVRRARSFVVCENSYAFPRCGAPAHRPAGRPPPHDDAARCARSSCTSRTCRRCCSTWRPIRRNWSISGATRRMRRCASRCSRVSSPGCARAIVFPTIAPAAIEAWEQARAKAGILIGAGERCDDNPQRRHQRVSLPDP